MLASVIVSPLIILIILAFMRALPGKKKPKTKKKKVSKKSK
jgi:hypothetical protein